MEGRRKIALLAGQPDENYQSLFIQGFLEQAFASNFDVCVFAMYQKYQGSVARETGESNIFTLPDYEMFDAVVILSDSIQTPDVLGRIEERLHASYKKPVICIDKESQYFPYVMTDHYTASKQVVAHLIEEHGFTDIAYLTGREAHPHSVQRLLGYYDCMEEHNLEINPRRVFYGDFWYSSGISVAKQLLKDRENLPQAVACANDCMAIGLAGELVKAGIRVPEDIAVTGYDVLPEGRFSPEPITSAPIPARECGIHAVKCLEASFAGEELPEFHASVELFIGSSCGCGCKDGASVSKLRDTWETERFQGDFNSDENHMEDDLLLQTDVGSMLNTIFSYVHQIRPFDSFHLCLNTDWMDRDAGGAYTDKMLHVLECGAERLGFSPVNLQAEFERNKLLPGLWKEKEHPMAYFFSPLFFEDHCLGYAVVSYGEEIKVFDTIYKKWLGTVMRSLECFRRIHNLEESVLRLQTGQIRDSLTGFYNYNGFVDNAVSMLACVPNQGYYIDMIALDFCGINEVFEYYSVSAGNQAVIDFSRMLEIAVGKGVSCALGNGEFLIAYFYNEKCESCVEDIREYMNKALEDYNRENGLGKLYISVGSGQRQIVDVAGFENLINEAVGNKNNNKTNEERHSHDKLTREEQDEAQFVADILDNNRFIYYFQPIVEAESGKIYAYEALMRADIEQYISPLQILKYAEYLGRLYDVEQATFTNVLKYLEENEDVFVGKKIFINSIPGNRLREEDNDFVWDRLEHYHNSVVVELTEQAELDDKELASLKALYKRLDIETAVDDYGTGYSNVTNLLRYMPNYVKIDRMLLAGIHLSPQKQHFVKEIIGFAHDNQIKVLAEGVETAEELKMVIALGVDLIQGYYTARPSAQVLSGIDSSLQNEIIQYRHAAVKQNGKKVYEAGQESRISLVKLVTGDYSRIQFNSGDVTHRDVTIVGIPGFEAEMDIVVEDSYVGRIELMDVYLKGQKKAPGIVIGNHCDVTLALNGENVIEQGGVIVPESSKLTVQGDGNLIMKQIAVDGCGIGNTKDEKHGELIFDQDGAIEVYGNTMHGIGIGSGQGGKLQINRGRYVINLSGQEAVGIGSLYADCSPVIHRGDIEIHMVNVSGVGIGSLTGSVSLEVRKTSVVGYFGGHKCTGIGTLEGEHCTLDIQDAIVNMDMRVDESCGIGSQTGETDIEMDHFRFQAAVKGKEALSMGNFAKTAKICLRQGDITSDVKNNLEADVGAAALEIINTRCQFKHNGEEIIRESIDEDE